MEILDDSPNGNNDDGWIDDLLHETNQDDPGAAAIKPVSQESESENSAVAKKKGKRVAYSVACTLHLSGSDYQVQLLPPSSEYDKAYRLNKVNAQKPTGYNVIQIGGEIICECSDFKFRQEGLNNKGCKHMRALIDMGMLSMSHILKRTGSRVFDE